MPGRKIVYPSDMPLNEGGFPAYDSLGRPTPWTEARARRHAHYTGRKARRLLVAKDRAEDRVAEQARVAAEAAACRARVVNGFSRPPGKLYGVDEAALMLIGPYGAIDASPLLLRTLALLSAKGRHDPEALLIAGWRDLDHLTGGLTAASPILAAVGLRLDRRSTGWRITRPRPTW